MAEGRSPRILACILVLILGLNAHGQKKSLSEERLWTTTVGTKINPLIVGKQPAVLVFMLTDCPIANIFAPELNRIVSQYSPNVSFTLVYVDQEITPISARQHTKEFGLNCLTVLDPTHSLAKLAGATTSPEAVVIAPGKGVVYRGRIDDRAVDYGKMRPAPKHRDLRHTLDLVLSGKPIPVSKTRVTGCIFRQAP